MSISISLRKFIELSASLLIHRAMVSSRSLHILLADDQPSISTSLSFVLRHAGHSVESVLNGAVALEKLRTEGENYDLLITDHSMPVMTGLELVGKLRDESFSREIIVVSSSVEPTTKQAYRDLGVAEFIAKPFDVVELRAAVEKIASGRSSQ